MWGLSGIREASHVQPVALKPFFNPKRIRHCCHWIVQTDGFTVHEIRQNLHMDEYKWISVFQKFAILLIVVYM